MVDRLQKELLRAERAVKSAETLQVIIRHYVLEAFDDKIGVRMLTLLTYFPYVWVVSDNPREGVGLLKVCRFLRRRFPACCHHKRCSPNSLLRPDCPPHPCGRCFVFSLLTTSATSTCVVYVSASTYVIDHLGHTHGRGHLLQIPSAIVFCLPVSSRGLAMLHFEVW